MLHLSLQQVDVAVARLCRLALQSGVDRALDACRRGRQLTRVGLRRIGEDALQRHERGDRLVLPEVLRDLLHRLPDGAVQHVAKRGLLDSRHVDRLPGDGRLVASRSLDGDGAAGGRSRLIADRERVVKSGVAAPARIGAGHRRGRRHHVVGVRGQINEVGAELVGDQAKDHLLGPRDHGLRHHHGVGADRLDGVRVEHLGHADAPHGALVDKALPGRKAVAEREHHDSREADADNEHPGVA